jgi:hypothetical protein
MDVNGPSELCLEKEYLPAVECVRRFCNLPGDLLKWVDECPPSADAETEEFEIGVCQHQMDYHDGVFVWKFERDAWDNGFMGGAFSGSFTVWGDGDYEPTSSDESDSSSSQESDDDEDLSN